MQNLLTLHRLRRMKHGPICLLWFILGFSQVAGQKHAPVWGDINYADDSLAALKEKQKSQ